MFRVSATGAVEELMVCIADLEVAGAEERGSTAEFWFLREDEARLCAARLSGARVERVEDRNWNAAWQDEWQPALVGARWFLTPPGYAGETPRGRLRQDMHRGTAFGNGDHATTRLCLAAMESLARPGRRFLDLGCGSGLLLEAAAALGATPVGCDLDHAALPSSGHCYAGSIDAIRPGSLDCLVANIQLGVLLDLMDGIGEALAPGGCAILSGILASQKEEARTLWSGPRWDTISIEVCDGWLAACLIRR